jgi:hypothetical protein
VITSLQRESDTNKDIDFFDQLYESNGLYPFENLEMARSNVRIESPENGIFAVQRGQFPTNIHGISTR